MKSSPRLKRRVLVWMVVALSLGALAFMGDSWAPTLRLLLLNVGPPGASATPFAPAPSVDPGPAPPAHVPAPRKLTVADLPAPFDWSRSNIEHDLTFHIDLDYFAPLGDGPANAALWLREFARDGRRWSETPDALLIEDRDGGPSVAFAPDDPVLLEAERWVDQKTCRFYPDVYPLDGPRTSISNMLFAINLAKSWTVRGDRAPKLADAKEDYRRAIRLGRLLLQDDVTLIQRLIGLACVARGLRGLNYAARQEGDATMVAATSLALADYAAIRRGIGDRANELDILNRLRLGWLGYTVDVRPDEFDSIVAAANSGRDRAFRLEAQLQLWVLKDIGVRSQRRTARETLSALTRSPDPLVAANARWYAGRPLTRKDLKTPTDD